MDRCVRMLYYIMVPIAKPMIIIIVVIAPNPCGIAAVLSALPRRALRTITQGLVMLKGQYGLDDTTLFASILFRLMVPLLCLFFFQRQITMGPTVGR